MVGTEQVYKILWFSDAVNHHYMGNELERAFQDDGFEENIDEILYSTDFRGNRVYLDNEYETRPDEIFNKHDGYIYIVDDVKVHVYDVRNHRYV